MGKAGSKTEKQERKTSKIKHFVSATISHRQDHVSLAQRRIVHVSVRLHVNVRLKLNDIDAGLCKHTVIFTHMMMGKLHSTLDWSFRGCVTLSILDQAKGSPDRNHISETLMAKLSLLAFIRPTKNRNYKGYRYVEFGLIKDVFAASKI